MDLAFVTHTVDGRSILVVSGEIDLATVPQLRTRLVEIARRPVSLVVDLSQVGFIDSTGLGVLVGAQRRLRETGGDLTLVIPQPSLRRVFALTGLDEIFSIVDVVPSGSGS